MDITDIGNGRGWLDAPAAASLARVDRQIGHPLQITDAGRTYEQQVELREKYERGEGSYAAVPGTSPHEFGNAIDTNERLVDILHDHGWRRPLADEPWHFVYWPDLDNHVNDPAPAVPGKPHLEDNMDIIHSNGREYGIAPGVISHLGTTGHSARLQHTTGNPVRTLAPGIVELGETLDNYGIPRNVLDGAGRVFNPENDRFEDNGFWSWERVNTARLAKIVKKLGA
ncbi:M15 family metallopeptidase [Microbacterium resistens]